MSSSSGGDGVREDEDAAFEVSIAIDPWAFGGVEALVIAAVFAMAAAFDCVRVVAICKALRNNDSVITAAALAALSRAFVSAA